MSEELREFIQSLNNRDLQLLDDFLKIIFENELRVTYAYGQIFDELEERDDKNEK